MNLHGNKRNASLLLIVFSLIAIGFGIHEITRHDVDCGEQVMQTNQICQSTSDIGTNRGDTIGEQRTSNTVWGVISLIGAALAGGYAVRNLILIRKASTMPVPPMWAPPPEPPGPGWPTR
jgi:hypothetical protein